MSITINLAPDKERRLHRRASLSGKAIPEYIEDLIDQDIGSLRQTSESSQVQPSTTVGIDAGERTFWSALSFEALAAEQNVRTIQDPHEWVESLPRLCLNEGEADPYDLLMAERNVRREAERKRSHP